MAPDKIMVRFACGHLEEKEVARTALRDELIKKWGHCPCTACCHLREDALYPPDKYRLVRMHYSQYIGQYKDCHVRTNSYDKNTKYVAVYVPK